MVILWPVVLIGTILELRIRFTSWPKRCSLKTGCNIRWFIYEWLYSKEKKINKIFRPLGYNNRITPGTKIKNDEIEKKYKETAIELLGAEEGGKYPWWK